MAWQVCSCLQQKPQPVIISQIFIVNKNLKWSILVFTKPEVQLKTANWHDWCIMTSYKVYTAHTTVL